MWQTLRQTAMTADLPVPGQVPPDQIAESEANGSTQGTRRGFWSRRGTAGVTIAAQLGFEAISHRYGEMQTLSDISLSVEPGEVLCLLGQSGCGKSTLLRIAAGIEIPAAGRILLNNREVTGPDIFVPPERRNIGLVVQDFALFPHLPIINNVAFGLHALPRAEALRAAMAILKRVGLEHKAAAYPHHLSGGQQQRVALARAIAPRPGVVLMDEPFSGLDRRLRDLVREETLALIRETRATCMIVTHDPHEAMRIGDRIALMRAGRLVQTGTASDLYQRPRDLEVAQFFSEINMFDATVHNGAVKTVLGTRPAPGMAEGTPVTMCLRPHEITLSGENGPGQAGRILRHIFAGETDLLEIALAGRHQPLKVQAASCTTPHAGADVTVRATGPGLIFARRTDAQADAGEAVFQSAPGNPCAGGD